MAARAFLFGLFDFLLQRSEIISIFGNPKSLFGTWQGGEEMVHGSFEN